MTFYTYKKLFLSNFLVFILTSLKIFSVPRFPPCFYIVGKHILVRKFAHFLDIHNTVLNNELIYSCNKFCFSV